MRATVTKRTPERAAVGLVGSGALARALARALVASGVRTALWSRSLAKARGVASATGASALPSLEQLAAACDLLLLCVPGAALEPLAARLAALEPRRGRVLLHCHGPRGSAGLSAARVAGFATGSVHPLVPLAPRGTAPAQVFRGCAVGLSGSRAAQGEARRLFEALGASCFSLPDTDRQRAGWHAAAALTSNAAVALVAEALDLACASGLRRTPARRALAALLRSTAAALERAEPSKVLSGAIARGEFELLRQQLALLLGQPLARSAFATLGLAQLALVRSRLPVAQARALERLLRAAR